ncbi:MAG: DoxX family protein [Xanthomonadales bacterium]|nr:DoxX family protein [Xanthomonadales bacterium]MCB1634697.1 DoxX family protein [Xanthomonadales bacterium]
MLSRIFPQIDALRAQLAGLGTDFSLLFLRLIMAYEFGMAGFNKLGGENWFTEIMHKLPFPLNYAPADISWVLASYTEVIAAGLLVVGLFTRAAAYGLVVVTAVAIVSVHWPESYGSLSELWQGYAIRNEGMGNFKMPLLFMLMLLPIVFQGPGRISLDRLLVTLTPLRARVTRGELGLADVGIALLALGLPLAQVMPLPGWLIFVAGAICAGLAWRQSRTESITRP